MKYSDKRLNNLTKEIIATQNKLKNQTKMADFLFENWDKDIVSDEMDVNEDLPDNISLDELIKDMGIEFEDKVLNKYDWNVIAISGIIGSILDVIITQTQILRPMDSMIKDLFNGEQVSIIQKRLDLFSNGFRNGKSAPIDYQSFPMFGNRSIHQIYSFGHDPIRFIEGILQIITGEYRGVDKYGNPINVEFGEGIPNLIHGVISYVAHMLSDFFNSNSLPYPGSTLFMEFGNEQIRQDISAAYRGQLLNLRTFIYQGMPSLLISIIINSWAIYESYNRNGKIDLLAGRNSKYVPMFLYANSIVASFNISINSIRIIFGDKRAIMRFNWPVIAETIRRTVQYIKNENKEHKELIQNIDLLYNQVMN